jgi:subtilase family serine protease
MSSTVKKACLVLWATFAVATPAAHATTLGPVSLFEGVKVTSNWVSIGAPKAESVVNLRIALKQNNIAGLEKMLLDISNPQSPNYGK